MHPTLDILMTGGRDSACRVWDMRTKNQVYCLSGHETLSAASWRKMRTLSLSRVRTTVRFDFGICRRGRLFTH